VAGVQGGGNGACTVWVGYVINALSSELHGFGLNNGDGKALGDSLTERVEHRRRERSHYDQAVTKLKSIKRSLQKSLRSPHPRKASGKKSNTRVGQTIKKKSIPQKKL